MCQIKYPFGEYCKSREGMIIECPLNGQYHDRRDVILTSRMAVSNNFITVTVIQNIRYYDEQKSRNVRITKNDGLEMTISEK